MISGKYHFASACEHQQQLFQDLTGESDLAPDDVERTGDLEPSEIIGVAVSQLRETSHGARPFVLDVIVARDLRWTDRQSFVPRWYGGMPVRIIAGGRNFPRQAIAPAMPDPPRGHTADPLRPGCSISRDVGHAGTLGCFVIKDQRIYLLSSAHVLAGLGVAAAGDPIFQPAGTYGFPKRVVARLSEWWPKAFDGRSVTVDAAIAELEALRWDDRVPQLGLLQSPRSRPYDPGQPRTAEKFGQRTGYRVVGTDGLRSSAASIRARTAAGTQQRYKHQFLVDNYKTLYPRRVSKPARFAAAGDSGAIAVDAAKRPVGLVTAVNKRYALLCPIAEVLKAFNVQLLTRSNR